MTERQPFSWFNEASKTFMERDYLLPGQTIEERVRIIADYAESILGIEGYADKLYDYVSRGWYSLSTPIWINFGTERGLGISCFGSYIDDSVESLLYTQAEVGMMTKLGGGTSAYFGALRHRGATIRDNGKSSGSAHAAQLYNSVTNIISQGSSRRGFFAGYQDIEHFDINEWLTFRTEGSPIQDISYGVNVSDSWLESMKAGDEDKRTIWAKVLQMRSELGFPYIFFTDNVNNNTVDVYKDLKMKIHASQMCTEISLPSTVDESFVCTLASQNALYYDEWKDTDATEVIVFLLDAVTTDFVNKASKIPFMERAVKFAERHRALGVGVLGYHSYLQSKMIPFESWEAKSFNIELFKNQKEQAYKASEKLAIMFGEPEILRSYGRRNTTLLAVAPTKSSSFILGQVSECVEPNRDNYFIKDLAKIKFTFKNPYLLELLKFKDKDTMEVWTSILKSGGSVQHLVFLSEHEKNVFKTFGEISQKEIIIQASSRQKYIDQAQSINLMIHPSASTKDVNALILEAHELGIKTLYYQHSTNAAQEFSRSLLTCSACE